MENVGESFSPTRIFPSGGGMKMRASRGCVGGGAPGTRVCAYAHLRMRRPVARAVRSRASCARLVRAPGDASAQSILGRKITGGDDQYLVTTLPDVVIDRRLATSPRPPWVARIPHPTTTPHHARDDWERGGEGVGRKVVEKKTLTTARTSSKVSASSPTQPNKHQYPPI